MGARGPNTSFKPDYCDLARRVCMLGATNETWPSSSASAAATIGNWLQEFPEFKKAVDGGQASSPTPTSPRSSTSAPSATSAPATRFFARPGRPAEQVKYTYHHAPDTGACHLLAAQPPPRPTGASRIEHRAHAPPRRC